MAELAKLHPDLFRRVQLKGFVNLLLGITLIFPGILLGTQPNNARAAGGFLPLWAWGIPFLIIGVGILYGSYRSNNMWKFARRWLRAGFIYSLFWLFMLVFSAIVNNPSSSSIVILWGYWVYNQYLVGHDSGWEGAEEVRKVRENGR